MERLSSVVTTDNNEPDFSFTQLKDVEDEFENNLEDIILTANCSKTHVRSKTVRKKHLKSNGSEGKIKVRTAAPYPSLVLKLMPNSPRLKKLNTAMRYMLKLRSLMRQKAEENKENIEANCNKSRKKKKTMRAANTSVFNPRKQIAKPTSDLFHPIKLAHIIIASTPTRDAKSSRSLFANQRDDSPPLEIETTDGTDQSINIKPSASKIDAASLKSILVTSKKNRPDISEKQPNSYKLSVKKKVKFAQDTVFERAKRDPWEQISKLTSDLPHPSKWAQVITTDTSRVGSASRSLFTDQEDDSSISQIETTETTEQNINVEASIPKRDVPPNRPESSRDISERQMTLENSNRVSRLRDTVFEQAEAKRVLNETFSKEEPSNIPDRDTNLKEGSPVVKDSNGKTALNKPISTSNDDPEANMISFTSDITNGLQNILVPVLKGSDDLTEIEVKNLIIIKKKTTKLVEGFKGLDKESTGTEGNKESDKGSLWTTLARAVKKIFGREHAPQSDTHTSTWNTPNTPRGSQVLNETFSEEEPSNIPDRATNLKEGSPVVKDSNGKTALNKPISTSNDDPEANMISFTSDIINGLQNILVPVLKGSDDLTEIEVKNLITIKKKTTKLVEGFKGLDKESTGTEGNKESDKGSSWTTLARSVKKNFGREHAPQSDTHTSTWYTPNTPRGSQVLNETFSAEEPSKIPDRATNLQEGSPVVKELNGRAALNKPISTSNDDPEANMISFTSDIINGLQNILVPVLKGSDDLTEIEVKNQIIIKKKTTKLEEGFKGNEESTGTEENKESDEREHAPQSDTHTSTWYTPNTPRGSQVLNETFSKEEPSNIPDRDTNLKEGSPVVKDSNGKTALNKPISTSNDDPDPNMISFTSGVINGLQNILVPVLKGSDDLTEIEVKNLIIKKTTKLVEGFKGLDKESTGTEENKESDKGSLWTTLARAVKKIFGREHAPQSAATSREEFIASLERASNPKNYYYEGRISGRPPIKRRNSCAANVIRRVADELPNTNKFGKKKNNSLNLSI